MRKDFVVHFDELQRLFCDVDIGGGDRGDGVAFIEHLVLSQTIITKEFGVYHGIFAYVGQYSSGLRQSCRGDNRPHPWHHVSLAGIDTSNPRVGVGAPQYLSVEHSRKM